MEALDHKWEKGMEKFTKRQLVEMLRAEKVRVEVARVALESQKVEMTKQTELRTYLNAEIERLDTATKNLSDRPDKGHAECERVTEKMGKALRETLAENFNLTQLVVALTRDKYGIKVDKADYNIIKDVMEESS